VVEFETSLRPPSKDSKLLAKEKTFSCIPYKDKKEFPRSYPRVKEELKIRKENSLTGKKTVLKSAL